MRGEAKERDDAEANCRDERAVSSEAQDESVFVSAGTDCLKLWARVSPGNG